MLNKFGFELLTLLSSWRGRALDNALNRRALESRLFPDFTVGHALGVHVVYSSAFRVLYISLDARSCKEDEERIDMYIIHIIIVFNYKLSVLWGQEVIKLCSRLGESISMTLVTLQVYSML